MDSSRERYFINVFYGRCCHHVVYKTYEKDVGKDRNMKDVRKGPEWGYLVRQWVYSLCNGKGALTKEEYELSKDMLFDLLNTNEDLEEGVGWCRFSSSNQ